MKRILFAILAGVVVAGCTEVTPPDAGFEPAMKMNNGDARNTISVNGFEFEIDPADTYLSAHISAQGVTWELQATAKPTDKYENNHDAPYYAPTVYVFFTADHLSDWRELSAREIDVGIDDWRDQSLLPNNQSVAYMGYHLHAYNHKIQFSSRLGNAFRVHWTCDAREAEHEAPNRFVINATIAFRTVWVDFRDEMQKSLDRVRQEPEDKLTPEQWDRAADVWQPDMERAWDLIDSQFTRNDFHSPKKMQWSVEFQTSSDSK